MTSQLREFHRPATVAEAAALLQRTAVPTAPLAWGPRVPDTLLSGAEAVVDLSQLDLGYIHASAGVLRLGAALSVQSLADSALLRSTANGIMAEAAMLSAGSGLRHAATLGGALSYARQAARGAAPEGPPELLLALLVLGAEVVYSAAGTAHAVAQLRDYLAQAPGEADADLLLEVRFARPGISARAALARVARTPRDQAIVAAVALIDGPAVRLAVAPGGSAPARLPAVEQALDGQPTTEERLAAVQTEVAAAVSPHTDFRASAAYRRAMAGVLTRRALAAAASQGVQ